MKVKDIKSVLDFLNKDEMATVKRVVMVIGENCPSAFGLIKDGCFCNEKCFECWGESLELKENQDKLDNVI